jgi:hypothetical protein
VNVLFRFALAAALIVAGLAPAAAQYVPPGSYQQSCVDIRTNGNQLFAKCTAPNGRYIGSSIQLGSCRGGDIANSNGYLRCNGGGGGGGYYPPHNGGGYYGRVPQGSYQASCRNVYMNGSMLSAQCTATNGAWTNSSLQVNRCQPGTDIANINGRLNCLAYR